MVSSMGRGKDLASDKRVVIQNAVKNGKRTVKTIKEGCDFTRKKAERTSTKRTAALVEKVETLVEDQVCNRRHNGQSL